MTPNLQEIRERVEMEKGRLNKCPVSSHSGAQDILETLLTLVGQQQAEIARLKADNAAASAEIEAQAWMQHEDQATIARLKAALERLAGKLIKHWSCGNGIKAPPWGSGLPFEWVGCELFHSEDPEECCMGCEAQYALSQIKAATKPAKKQEAHD